VHHRTETRKINMKMIIIDQPHQYLIMFSLFIPFIQFRS